MRGEISQGSRFCDGVSRRSFVRAGFLGLGGLTLADLLRLRASAAQQSQGRRNTSVIFVELAGGPTHFETYDPKPLAPAEYRGPLGVISTALSGVHFSELMAEQAKVADRLAIIRSVHHKSNSHDTSSHLTQTGFYKRSMKGGANTFPSIGSIVARLKGPNGPGLPGYVSLPRVMRNGKASFAGAAYNPFETGGDPNKSKFEVQNLELTKGITVDRLSDRRALQQSLDSLRQLADREGVINALDDFDRQAFELVAGGRAQRAFDISQEKARTRDRYGRNSVGQNLLLARRLVEAGSTFVSVRVTGWDDHSKIAMQMQKKGPDYDQGMAALVEDLHQRGLNQEVLVVAMGEFGRTPRINKNAGRDHWGAVMSVLLAGGPVREGQIIGASNSKGEVPAERPYRPENVLATIYRHLGIDPATTLDDFDGRPRHLLEERSPIVELA